MLGFLYSLLLKSLYPTSLSLLLLGGAVAFRKRRAVCRACFALAVGVLLVCGNGWLIRGLTKHLEWQYLPSHPVPATDAILVLSGGILNPRPPRPTVEIGDAGDRLLYGAYLYRQHKAPHIICTGNVATGGIAPRPVAEDMSEFLILLGIPATSIIAETKSENTYQHARSLRPVFREHRFKRVLLVTSALHMPRSLGTFRKQCPDIEFIPAPTDFHCVERLPMPWYRHFTSLVPTPRNLLDFSDAMHEYLGIAWYRLRGWM